MSQQMFFNTYTPKWACCGDEINDLPAMATALRAQAEWLEKMHAAGVKVVDHDGAFFHLATSDPAVAGEFGFEPPLEEGEDDLDEEEMAAFMVFADEAEDELSEEEAEAFARAEEEAERREA